MLNYVLDLQLFLQFEILALGELLVTEMKIVSEPKTCISRSTKTIDM
jgi:hypothetical protein